MIFLRLLFLFTVVPFVELYLLFLVGERLGAGWTVAIIVLTGAIGAALARRQGLTAWRSMQSELAQGRPPGEALLDGVMILLAGALLVTPGLLTDIAGFSLLVPPFRRTLRRALWMRWQRRFTIRAAGFHTVRQSTSPPPDPDVIDVEFTRKDAP